MDFEDYYIVLLRRGENGVELSEEQLEELQRKHVAFIENLQQSGLSLTAGPFDVPYERDLRGLIIFPGELPLEQVEEIARQDPAVQVGRLQAEILKWWTPAGRLSWQKESV